MRADSSKNIGTPCDLEGKAVGSGDASLPYLPRVLHLFDLQGGVLGIGKQKPQLLIGYPLNPLGQISVGSHKWLGEKELHDLDFFKALRASSMFSKGPTTSPLAMA